MKWKDAEKYQFIANLPSEACFDFTPGLAWLLAGLRTRRRGRQTTAFLLTHLPGSEKTSGNWVFDPAYRCGAVPDSHRIPFRRSPWERHQQAKHKIKGCSRHVNPE
jgi:hypothetical protein